MFPNSESRKDAVQERGSFRRPEGQPEPAPPIQKDQNSSFVWATRCVFVTMLPSNNQQNINTSGLHSLDINCTRLMVILSNISIYVRLVINNMSNLWMLIRSEKRTQRSCPRYLFSCAVYIL